MAGRDQLGLLFEGVGMGGDQICFRGLWSSLAIDGEGSTTTAQKVLLKNLYIPCWVSVAFFSRQCPYCPGNLAI